MFEAKNKNGYTAIEQILRRIPVVIGLMVVVLMFVGNASAAPVPEITEPLNGTTVSGNITIEANETTGATIDYCLFEYTSNEINWTEIGNDTDESDGWNVSWNTSSEVSDGDYFIRVNMTDVNGSHGYDTIEVYINNEVPNPWISNPLNDNILYGDNITITYGNATEITAVDLNFDYDINSTIFEYSVNGVNWIVIGTDTYGGPEPVDNDTYNESIGYMGWSTTWNTTGLGEGAYYLRVTMIDNAGQSMQYQKQVYYDLTPPLPEIYDPSYYASISGVVEFKANTNDEDIIYMVITFLNRSRKCEVVQEGLGREKQSDVKRHVRKGQRAKGGYCAPTAAKNALHRLAVKNPDLVKVPKEHEQNYKKYFKIKKLKGYKLEDYIKDGKLTNLGLAIVLSKKMKTGKDGVGGTKSKNNPEGIKAYLKQHNLGCDNNKGYAVKEFWTVRWNEATKKWEWNTPPQATWRNYEQELRGNEAVIFCIAKSWSPGKDGKYGTSDDVIRRGHCLAGKSAKVTKTKKGAIKSKEADYIDSNYPKTTKRGKWKTKTLPNGKKVDMIKVGGRWCLVKYIFTVSPKPDNKKHNETYVEVGKDTLESDGWSVPWDTSKVPDGCYLVKSAMVDAKGNSGTDMITVVVDNNPPITTKTISEPKYWNGTTWIVTPSTRFTLIGDDGNGSGVNYTYYRIWYDNAWSNWTEYNESFTLSGEGKHIIEYYSVDYAGHVEDVHSEVDIVILKEVPALLPLGFLLALLSLFGLGAIAMRKMYKR